MLGDDIPPLYEPGQVWKERHRNPSKIFLVLEVRTTRHNTERVKGVLVSSPLHANGEAEINPACELDARSLHRMYPNLLFDPSVNRPPEENK